MVTALYNASGSDMVGAAGGDFVRLRYSVIMTESATVITTNKAVKDILRLVGISSSAEMHFMVNKSAMTSHVGVSANGHFLSTSVNSGIITVVLSGRGSLGGRPAETTGQAPSVVTVFRRLLSISPTTHSRLLVRVTRGGANGNVYLALLVPSLGNAEATLSAIRYFSQLKSPFVLCSPAP